MAGPRAGATTAEVLESVVDLVALLADQADQAEEERCVTDDVMAAATDLGLFRLVVPEAHGGFGLGLEPLAQVTRLLGTGCPASAWTLSFLMLHNWLLTRFPEEAHAEVFAERGYSLVPAPLAPTGTLTPVADGWELTGRWEWATGVNHADWVMVNALEVGADTIAPRFALVPIDAVEVDDVWFTSGMRATGSNTVRIHGVVVPDHRTVPMAGLVDARPPEAGNALAAYPMMPVLALIAAAPALGAAEAAVDAYADRLRERVLAYTLGEKAVDQPAAQIRLATALADVRAARAVFDAAIVRLTAVVSSPAGATIAGASPAGATIAGASPAGASPAGASPAGASPAGASPAGASPAGASPAGASPAGASPAGASPAGASPVGASPAGASPAGASPAGASPAGASPAGASPAGASPAGASPAGASPAGASPAGASPAGATIAGATIADRMATRLAAANVVRMSREVIADVCAGAGASVYFQGAPLQRLQRDVEVLKGHVVFDWDRTAELAGRIELGLDLRPTDLV